MPPPDPATIARETARRRTFAIISHPDAGKTTLTEKLLLYSGLIRTAGLVKNRKGKLATSDWMGMEQERGITITSPAIRTSCQGLLIDVQDTRSSIDSEVAQCAVACGAASDFRYPLSYPHGMGTGSGSRADEPPDIDALHRAIDGCWVCRRNGLALRKQPGIARGNGAASVMVVGIAPSPAAMDKQLAFAGQSFARLRAWFAEAGYPADDDALRRHLYLTSLNKCAAEPDNISNRQQLWSRCQLFLWQQVSLVRPKLVLLLGSEVARTIGVPGFTTLDDAVGQSWSTATMFSEHLFPPVAIEGDWLVMPHPSGLSRTMNDPAVSRRVIASLRASLLKAEFSVTSVGGSE